MKVLNKITLVLCGILGIATLAAQENRGLSIILKDSSGEDVSAQLYSGSYALIIGNDTYDHWPKLPSVPEETEAVKQALHRHGFIIFGDQVLRNLKEEELRKAYESFIDDHGLDPANRLVLYFAGHGYSRKQGDLIRGYLVPADAPSPAQDETGFVRTSITMREVQNWMYKIEAKHALFLFDSCFSGTVFATRSAEIKPPATITSLVTRPSRQFLTAGSADEKVPSQSVFTRAFVDALSDPVADYNEDRYVTGTELGLHVRNQVAEFAGNSVQFGTIRNNALSQGDIVFALEAIRTKPLEEEDISSWKLSTATELLSQLEKGLDKNNLDWGDIYYNYAVSMDPNVFLSRGTMVMAIGLRLVDAVVAVKGRDVAAVNEAVSEVEQLSRRLGFTEDELEQCREIYNEANRGDWTGAEHSLRLLESGIRASFERVAPGRNAMMDVGEMLQSLLYAFAIIDRNYGGEVVIKHIPIASVHVEMVKLPNEAFEGRVIEIIGTLAKLRGILGGRTDNRLSERHTAEALSLLQEAVYAIASG